MKYLSLILLFFSLQSFGQITGNTHVKDSSAIKLDAAAINKLLGKWKLVESIELLRDEEERRDWGILVDFDQQGGLATSWCMGCHETIAGQWEVLHEQTINFSLSQTENKALAGEWVVYQLSDEKMTLAKILTSTGNWKKLHHFSRAVENPALTEKGHYCTNCSSDDQWCWGDRPEEAKRQNAILADLINTDGEQFQHAAEILAAYDWLLNNAPCMHNYLYLRAIHYYERLLAVEKSEHNKQAYQRRLQEIHAQHQLYFTDSSRKHQ